MQLEYLTCRVQYVNDVDVFASETTLQPIRPAAYVFSCRLPLASQLPAVHRQTGAPQQLSDATLQMYKNGEFAAYLDMESSINEQAEEFEGFDNRPKNSLVVRTKLEVRCHNIMERLLTADSRQLRRALFSLKQIFQDDKDIVQEFISNEGLDCLVKIGEKADSRFQNYILRALGQLMLYVDGMHGLMKNLQTISWLYQLLDGDQLVAKTALKLLLVFVEYHQDNAAVLATTVIESDKQRGETPWHGVVRTISKCIGSEDTEQLVYAVTLLQTCLDNIPLSGCLPNARTRQWHVEQLTKQKFSRLVQIYSDSPGADPAVIEQLINCLALPEEQDSGYLTTPEDQNHSCADNNNSNNNAQTESRRKSIIKKPCRNGSAQLKFNARAETACVGNHANGGEVFAHSGKTLETHGKSSSENIERSPVTRKSSSLKPWALAMMYVKSTSKDDDKDNDNVENMKELCSNRQRSSSQAGSPTKSQLNENGARRMQANGKILPKQNSGDVAEDTQSIEIVQKTDSDEHWELIRSSLTRPLFLAELDFTDLTEKDDIESVVKDGTTPGAKGGIPPPPPLPPPLSSLSSPPLKAPAPPPPPPLPPAPLCPPPPQLANRQSTMRNGDGKYVNGGQKSHNKKTVKLFWRELKLAANNRAGNKNVWEDLPKVAVDEAKLLHLFEVRVRDCNNKLKSAEQKAVKELCVLSNKRSNAINISLTKLPPPRSIKTAILKMDASIMNKECIERILGLMPTKEEIDSINEAQINSPDTPLASAETFLHTLGSISQLHARLKFWTFRLDYDNTEKEVAEQLMDLKQGMEVLRKNQTFKCILAALRGVGNFLNGTSVQAFNLDYLSKVADIKDTVHRNSLMHHICEIVFNNFPETTDLYSEIGAITRVSHVNFDEISNTVDRLQRECKQSWNYLREIMRHDGCDVIGKRAADFLTDAAERIIILAIVQRRVLTRFNGFLTWCGIPSHRSEDVRPDQLCRVISEFALEYRTSRERLQQQRAKRANHRQRNKTRGKLITDAGLPFEGVSSLTTSCNPATVPGEPAESTGTQRGHVHKSPQAHLNGNANGTQPSSNGDGSLQDSMLESLARNAASRSNGGQPRRGQRYRRRCSRNSEMAVQVRRTIYNGLSEEQKQLIAALNKSA